ncbi:hypothetical protein QBC38DRAFT_514002 [Podospora fimiseda]|uniref:Uncharacterized protein n=1 Tax=Podospora fimiseda TaxID=252190 RepID=A0AAN6YJN1_9PEZI|nr:hypothetical protein QBC38DRAFT_514002 [Podospora fimiseda]
MTLVHNLSEHRVRVLFDTGSQIPVVSLSKARVRGRYFTDHLVLRHQGNHCTRLSFELTDMDDECDVILPQWWMTQHQPSNLFGRPEEIAFDSAYCRENCTPSRVTTAALQVSTEAVLDAVPARFREFLPVEPGEAGGFGFPDLAFSKHLV